jgi:hypothetical protein
VIFSTSGTRKINPLVSVGRLTLNANPHNHFQEMELAIFSPFEYGSGRWHPAPTPCYMPECDPTRPIVSRSPKQDE